MERVCAPTAGSHHPGQRLSCQWQAAYRWPLSNPSKSVWKEVKHCHSPEYISFLLVRLCHTYDQTVHILQKFVPLKPKKRKDKSNKCKWSCFDHILTRRHSSTVMPFRERHHREGGREGGCLWEYPKQTSNAVQWMCCRLFSGLNVCIHLTWNSLSGQEEGEERRKERGGGHVIKCCRLSSPQKCFRPTLQHFLFLFIYFNSVTLETHRQHSQHSPPWHEGCFCRCCCHPRPPLLLPPSLKRQLQCKCSCVTF